MARASLRPVRSRGSSSVARACSWSAPAPSAVAIATALGAGADHLSLLNRSGWRAEGLGRRLGQAYPTVKISVYSPDEVEKAAEGADVIVNATYLGMKDDDPPPVPPGCLAEGMAVCDEGYRG